MISPSMDRAISTMKKLLGMTVGSLAGVSNATILKSPKDAPRLARRSFTVVNEQRGWCEHIDMLVPALGYWTTASPDQLRCMQCVVGKPHPKFDEQFVAHMREVAAIGQEGVCGECKESAASLHSVMLPVDPVYVGPDAATQATPAVIIVAGLCDDCLTSIGVPRSAPRHTAPMLS